MPQPTRVDQVQCHHLEIQELFRGCCGTCWRRQWHPSVVLLPGKSHGQRSLVGCSPWGCTESDTTEWLHFHFSLSCIGEGNGNPLQCSCLENPREGEPGGLPSMGSHRVRHDWSNIEAAAAVELVETFCIRLVLTLDILHSHIVDGSHKHYSIQFIWVAQLCLAFFVTHWLQHAKLAYSSPAPASLFRLVCIETVIPSNHLILCHPLLLLPSIFPGVSIFSSESVLHIR